MPDRADLGEVTAEGQAGSPVDHRARLAGDARGRPYVVGPRPPPGREAAELAAADPSYGLVAAEVDEGRVAAVLEAPRRSHAQLGGDVAGRDRTLPNSVLGGRGAKAAARVRRRSAIADGPNRVRSAHSQVLIDGNATPLVERQRELPQAGVGRNPRGPNYGAGRQRLATREPSTVGCDLVQSRLEADVDAAPAQLAQGVVGEPGVDLGQHPPGGLDQDPAHAVPAGARGAPPSPGAGVLER